MRPDDPQPGEAQQEVRLDIHERVKAGVEAVLEVYLRRVSSRRIGGATSAMLGIKISEDAASRIAAQLEQVRCWRERSLERC